MVEPAVVTDIDSTAHLMLGPHQPDAFLGGLFASDHGLYTLSSDVPFGKDLVFIILRNCFDLSASMVTT